PRVARPPHRLDCPPRPRGDLRALGALRSDRGTRPLLRRSARILQSTGSMIETGQIPLDHGPLSYAAAGDGPAVVFLHQTPRSWDEYRDVLPRLSSSGYRTIAFDTPGFGGSAALTGEPTIERWADAAGRGLDALSIDRAAIV